MELVPYILNNDISPGQLTKAQGGDGIPPPPPSPSPDANTTPTGTDMATAAVTATPTTAVQPKGSVKNPLITKKDLDVQIINITADFSTEITKLTKMMDESRKSAADINSLNHKVAKLTDENNNLSNSMANLSQKITILTDENT